MQVKEALERAGSADNLASLLRIDVRSVKKMKPESNLGKNNLEMLIHRVPSWFRTEYETPWCILKEIDAKRAKGI